MRLRKVAPISLAVLACLSTCCGRKREGRTIVLRHMIRMATPGGQVVPSIVYGAWRVHDNGHVEPLTYRFSESYIDSVQGSTAPSPSPDGRWIAYGSRNEDYEVHLLNVRTLRQVEITRWGKAPTLRSVSVNVLIGGWSPDSRRLLLNLTHGEDTSERGDLTIPKAPYGFYEYDVVSRRTSAIRLPSGFAFIAWTPDGRFVGVMSPGIPADDQVVMLRPGQVTATPVTALNASPYQVRASTDGKWLVGLHVEKAGPRGEQVEQIIKINLATLAATPLVTLKSSSGNSQPALSLDDKHVAYKREKPEHRTYYKPEESLLVDGRGIYSCPSLLDFKWVDDRKIAVACKDEVLVLDTDSGSIISKSKLGSSANPH